MLNQNPEMMRYRPNRFGFWMCMLAIIAQCVSFIAVYHCLQYNPEMMTGIDIIINIIFLLAVFLTSEKVKTYHVSWGYVSIVVGSVNLIRIWTYLFSPWSTEDLINTIPGHFFWLAFICFIVVAACLIAGGLVTIIRGRTLSKYLSSLDEKGAN